MIASLDALPVPVPYPQGWRTDIRVTTDLCVWHCTGGATARSSLDWLRTRPPGERAWYNVLIDRDGSAISGGAWDIVTPHAGRSAWPVPAGGVPVGASVNGRSIGVAFACRDDGRERVTEAQIVTALALAPLLAEAWPALSDIRAHRRHRDVAPVRKVDPLPFSLDWPAFTRRLAAVLA